MDVTLIVITDERHPFLKRILDYYLDAEVPIFVTDSSRDPYDLGSIPRHVTYLHSPGARFMDKMLGAIARVRSKYAVICGVDDFISLAGIRRCCEFLDDNPDYSSAQGRYIAFANRDSKPEGLEAHHEYAHSIGFKIDEPTPSARLLHCLDYYVQQFYAVHRTPILSRALQRSAPLENGLFREVMMTAVPAIHGRHKVIPVFYSAREWLPRRGGRFFVENEIQIDEAVFMEEYRSEVRAFAEGLASELVECEGISKDAALKVTEEAILRYVNFSRAKWKFESWRQLPATRERYLARWREQRPAAPASEAEAAQAFDDLTRWGDPNLDAMARAEFDRMVRYVLSHNVRIEG